VRSLGNSMSGDRYFEVGGARLRYRDDGDGPAVVLIHGWTLDLDMWEPQVNALSHRFRVVRFDRRGSGLSSGHPRLGEDAQDVRELCRYLGIACAAFVGMSQGARVLERLAAAEPKLVSSLVFDGAPDMRPGGTLTSNDVPLADYAALARSAGLEAVRQKWAAHALARLVTTDPQMHELLRRMISRYPGKDLDVGAAAASEAGSAAASVAGSAAASVAGPTAGRTASSLAATSVAGRAVSESAAAPAVVDLASVGVPVLVLTGELDLQTRRAAGDLLASLIPAAQRAIIPRAGHLPNLDNPGAYNEALLRFLSGAQVDP
jgi:3-oxoadipate enol-lactonase